MKGVLEALGTAVGCPVMLRAARDIPYLHPAQQAEIMVDGHGAGWIGAVHPEVLRSFESRTAAAVSMEIDLDLLDRYRSDAGRYMPLPRYPAVLRDMAVIIPERVGAAEVETAIRKAGGELVEGVRLFDLYRGGPVPPGKKSLAFSIQYRSADRTLTDVEVAAIHERILRVIAQELGGVLR
jgi:phenylalanyl-tRNA synthetase beta chain